MLIGVPRELLDGETRVAATPKPLSRSKNLALTYLWNKTQVLKPVLKIMHF